MICTSKINNLFQVLLILLPLPLSAQMYTCKDVRVTLFSSAPLEDIRAVSVKGTAVFSSQTGELVVQVPIRTLEFDKKLMQEHFNENYMESEQYPYAKFKGIVNSKVDFTKNGVYPVSFEGILSVHGVDKKRSIPAQLSVKDGTIRVSSRFVVTCVDHHIKIPTLMFAKIAESISITAEGQFR